MTEWDPLLSYGIDELSIVDARKRQIENILGSYTGYFDPFSEVIQNALDAVEKRVDNQESDYKPKIWIEIDLAKNSFSVLDNGIGFTRDEFHSFLTPNISYKVSGKSRGNKGVGATYLAYGFNYLEVGTKTPDFQSYAIFQNGRSWVSGPYAKDAPKVKEIDMPEDFQIDRGSKFVIKFSGEGVRPSDLSWIKATSAEQWEAVLRIKTPLGGIFLNDLGHTGPQCHIKVIDKDGSASEKEVSSCVYLYPHLVSQATQRLKDIIEEQSKLVNRGGDVKNDLPGNMRNLWGIYEIWTYDDIESKKTIKPQLKNDSEQLLKKLKPNIYGFFGYSVSVWDYINDQKYKLSPRNRILNGGLQMATTNMPQGGLITIPLTSSIGYQKTSLVIVEFKDSKPDYGRKGFQPDIEQLAKELSVSVVNYLKHWSTHLRKETGSPIDIAMERGLHDWISMQENHEKEHPLKLRNENFFIPMREIPILSQPQQEQDVIVLFNQLIAGGVIRGIKIMATNAITQYDGLCRVSIHKPIENHQFDEKTNPLGIKDPLAKEAESPPWVLEYKFTLDTLLNEFDKEEKHEKDIKLVVCWSVGDKWREIYSIVPLLHFDNVGSRPFHGATHLVKNAVSGNHVFYLIVLSDLIEYLNDPVHSQKLQNEAYN